MKKEKLSRQEIISQWLDLFPARQVEHELSEDDRIILLVPHPENWFTRKFLPSPKRPAQRIRLDEIGSFLWRQFDGQKSLREICTELQENFSGEIQSAEERAVIFSQQLYKQKFISVFQKRGS